MPDFCQYSLPDTIFIGKSLYCYDELDSTNTFALDILSKTPPNDGTVIRALNQTKGKGQYGSTWASEKEKNLTFSVIIKSQFLALADIFYLNQVASLAVYNATKPHITDNELYIKWPNDILIHQKKTAGILIQNVLQSSKLKYSVIGIGLNVNQQQFDPELRHATSLSVATGKTYNLEDLLQTLCVELERLILKLREGNYKEIRELYISRLFGLHNKMPYITSTGERLDGAVEGIDPSGKLILQINGNSRLFDLKDISLDYEAL